eukprot:1347241-Ditylum_brightwellii.AAC.1
MSRDGNEPSTSSNKPKQQGGSLLSFLDHNFKAYHTTEWYQWELNIQMLAKGTTQLNTANNNNNNLNIYSSHSKLGKTPLTSCLELHRSRFVIGECLG